MAGLILAAWAALPPTIRSLLVGFTASATAIALAVASVGAAYRLGDRHGSARVQAEWDIAAAARETLELRIVDVVETFAARIQQDIAAATADAERRQAEAVRTAEAADAAPVDPACRDVRRGLPRAVVHGIDGVR